MEGKFRKLFAGANTSNGSFNYFDYMIPNNVKRIFCLKGGPGVGKSSMMKKMATEFIKTGYDVELYYCPSDPSSLDGLVIKDLGVVLLDATSPHIVDPKNPGAIDEIINLGDYWDVEKLEENKDKIIECGLDIGESFKRAYKFLKSAEPIYYDIEQKYTKCMDFGKINLVTENFIEDIFSETTNKGYYKKEKHLFGTAITPVGHIDYADSILNQAKKVYYLKGEIGTGKTTFLKKVYNKALEKGMEVEVYHYPLIKEKIETIFIRDLGIGITTSSIFDGEDTIDLNKYINQDKFIKFEEEIIFDKKIFDELITYGILNLQKAKLKHDDIEAYYIPNMKFDEINKLQDNIVNRILGYDK